MSNTLSFLCALLACAATMTVLQGCETSETTCPPPHPEEVLAEQLCDNRCVVQIKCGSNGECLRAPNDKCLIKDTSPCVHHETCQEFRDEDIEQQQCDKMTSCCAFNSVLMGNNEVVDPICNLATVKTGNTFCEAVNYTAEILGEQLCDNGCVVHIKCDVDGACLRVPNDRCLSNTPAPCFHHETCQEFKAEATEKKECNKMTACCRFNSILTGDSNVTDPICTLATPKTDNKFCEGFNEAEALV